MRANTDIRAYAKSNCVRLWEIATALNISEPTMTRKMRFEMSDDEKREYYAIIDRVAAEHAAQIAAASAK